MQQDTIGKVFISHSSKDKEYGEELVWLLRSIGLKKEQIIFTSNPSYGIPVNQNIYQYLKEQICNHAHMLYLLSENYYDSMACMNEMGAVWIEQNEYTLIMLPGFLHTDARFQNSVFDKNKMTVGLDDKIKIKQLINILIDEYSLSPDKNDLLNVYQEFFDRIDGIKKRKMSAFQVQNTEEYDRQIAENPYDYKLYVRRADALLIQDKKNYRQAVRDYLYAMFLNPDNKDACYKLLQVAAVHEEYSSVLAFADKLCEEYPKRAMMFGCRAYIKCAKERYEQAIEDCDRAISLDGGAPNRWFYNTRGRCNLLQGKLEAALEDFWEAHERDTSYEPAIENIKIVVGRMGLETMHKKAVKAKEAKEYQRAKMYFESILMQEPENERAVLEYGGLNYEAGKHEEALSLWEGLLNKKKDCRNYYLCGVALLCLGRKAEARDYMRRALDYPDPEYHNMALEVWNTNFGGNGNITAQGNAGNPGKN